MSDDPLRPPLQAEGLHLQRVIADFDARAPTIDAWSVSFGRVVTAGAFASRAWAVLRVAAARERDALAARGAAARGGRRRRAGAVRVDGARLMPRRAGGCRHDRA